MENKKYVEPEMEVTMFDTNDVITTSNDKPAIDLPDDNWGE